MNASISRAIVIALSTIYLAGAANGQPNTTPNDDLKYWAMTVPVAYSEGSWKQLEPPFVVACDGPSDRSYSGDLTSMIRVMGPKGEVLRERRIANPRIHLPERTPENEKSGEKGGLADRAEFDLTVGLAAGAEVVAFYEDEKAQEPDLVIDVTQEIADAAKAAEKARPACQAGNPPFVAVGDSGHFVLAYAVEHAAKVSGMDKSDLVAQMAEKGDDFSSYATKAGLLTPAALDLLDSATVQR